MLTEFQHATGTDPRPVGLLEMGTMSLKAYLVGRPIGTVYPIETLKFPWRVGHSYFGTGAVGETTVREIVERVREAGRLAGDFPLAGTRAIATGVFRELPCFDTIAQRLLDATGVRAELISGRVEAELLVEELRARGTDGPTAAFDLGGATTEWAWLGGGCEGDCGSLPLGAIRDYYRHAHLLARHADYLAHSSDACDDVLNGLPVPVPVDVVATGGTVRSLASLVGSPVIDVGQVRALVVKALQDGAPPELSPSRREVFLPGLVILWRILVRCRARALRYGTSAGRRALVLRSLGALPS
jgi:exopolyphosphatase/guanosine-5'-triphosphate,3'-diphosphate pyrophosphatase